MAGAGGWRTGPGAGALLVAAGTAQVAALVTVALAVAAAGRSLPPWRGAGRGPDLDWGWQLAPAVALGVGATVLLLPRRARAALATAGAVAVLLALPAGWSATWPQVLAVDLVGGVALLLAVLIRPATHLTSLLTRALGGAVLLGHGLLVALAAPAGALVTLGVIAVVGLALAVRRGAGPYRRVAGGGLLVAQLALPGIAVVASFAAGAPPWWQARFALIAAGLQLVAVLAARRQRVELIRYAVTGALVAMTVPGLAPLVVAGNEPIALYAALAALGVALVVRWARQEDEVPVVVAAGALAVVAVLAALPRVLTALVSPYGDPGRVWSGVPTVVAEPAALPVGLALVVLAVAAVVTGRRVRPPVLPALPFAAAALPVLLVAVGAPWPVLPAAVLLAGSAALLLAALAAPRPGLAPIAVPLGVVLVASGVTGLLATRAGSLAAEGVLLVVAVVVAVGGRTVEVRVAGCLAAVGAASALAVTASLVGGLPLRAAAYPLLAVAALVLAVAAATTPARGLVGRVLDAAAQAVALVAAVLTVEAARHLATVCVLWGAAVALRLLRR
ncbi:hypothetical protein ABZU93_33390, partial [Micromonospora zamorensis]